MAKINTGGEYYEERRRVADRLRAARKAKGLSQVQLAELIDSAATYISEIETMASNPSVLTLFRICDALDLDPASVVSTKT